MPECIIPGCTGEGRNKLGVRCRVWHNQHPLKNKTDSLWAPDANAYLCDQHAQGGARVTVVYEPTHSGEISIVVVASQIDSERRTLIRL